MATSFLTSQHLITMDRFNIPFSKLYLKGFYGILSCMSIMTPITQEGMQSEVKLFETVTVIKGYTNKILQ